MKKIEYKTLNVEGGGMLGTLKIDDAEIEKKMNELGRDGWEFVRHIEQVRGGSTIKILMVFMRESQW